MNDIFHGNILAGTQVMYLDNEKMSFSFAVSIICHEMIHLWLDEQTTIPDLIAEAKLTHKKLDTHKVKFFQEKKQLAGTYGIKIMDYANGKEIDELSDITSKAMLKTDVARTDESEPVKRVVFAADELENIKWFNDHCKGVGIVELNPDGSVSVVS